MTEPPSAPDPWSQPYSEPTLIQPAYPPPTAPLYYDPAAAAQYYPPPPKRMSGGIKALLWAIPIVVVLALVGIGFALTGNSAAVNAVRTNSAAGNTSGKGDTFTMPATVLGLPQNTLPTLDSIIDPLKQTLGDKGTINAAVYGGKPASQDVLLLIGMSSSVSGEGATFQKGIILGLGISLNGANGKPYPAGPMGGTLECEDGTQGALKIGLCSLGDSGGALAVMYFNHTGAETAAAVLTLRPVIEEQG